MRKELTISLAVVGIVATFAIMSIENTPKSINLVSEEKGFASFVARHGKSYATKEEYLHRLQLYLKSYEIITHHNTYGDPSYTLGLNHFSDWTDEEYQRLLGYKPHSHNLSTALIYEPYSD
jgi:type II secretory pathway pseudopilin PulG